MNFEGLSQYLIYFGAGLVIGVLAAVVIIGRIMSAKARRSMSQTKDEFIALASHYLLTPISIIQGAITQLQERDSSLSAEERQKLYGLVLKGQQRLWILAEQFVLVSQISTGTMRLKLEAGNVADMVQSAIAAVDVFAREKNIRLEMIDDTAALREDRFDARRMKQTVLALLDNAVKFSPESSVIQVHVANREHSFAIEVIDQGPGMTGAAVDTVAQRFARGTSSYTFDHEGMGLGLFIANAIIREHGGELQFDTGRKRGTMITLQLPLQ